MSAPTTVPSEHDFLMSFGVEPIESNPADGYWCYRFDSDDGSGLRLSFNTHESSVQTVWESNGAAICTVVHEGAETVSIHGGEHPTLQVRFTREAGLETTLHIHVTPNLEIHWASVRV